MSHLADLIQIFAQTLEPEDQLNAETRQKILDFLHSLQAHDEDSFRQVLTSLQENYASRIMTILR